MNKELCFCIENTELYLEKVLVDYMDIPIFFLCKGNDEFYIVLCYDIDDLSYIITRISFIDVYNLLHGKMPMRNIFLKHNYYWEVISGDEVEFDCVTKHKIDDLDVNILPESEACFKILTNEIKSYVTEFDSFFFSNKEFYDSYGEIEINEEFQENMLDLILKDIDFFKTLGNYRIKFSGEIQIDIYEEYIDNIIKLTKDLDNIKVDSQWFINTSNERETLDLMLAA